MMLFTVLVTQVAWSTHNRAGEITYEQIDDLTIRATITTFTRTSSFSADRDTLTIFWGDGDSTVISRVNGNGEELPNDIKRNEYVGEHTYSTRGTFKLSVIDPNRIAGILNIDFPNSVNITFYLETTFTLLEPRFQGRNNSVVLLQPPIDFACPGEVFVYNPNAFDPDGDSLSYELITPFSSEGLEVPNYVLPDQISPGDDNQVFLDPTSGEFRWDSPQALGEYNITYRINEWRGGNLINSLVRDMQILVRTCPDGNQPPFFDIITEYCVIAGEELVIPILALDSNMNEILSLTASGGPFELEDSPASLEILSVVDSTSSLTARIIWQTTCEHVADESYQIVVRATDEITKPNTVLAALESIRIKVTAPPPDAPSAVNQNNVVSLSWPAPYRCQEAGTFRGFSVWRRLGSRSIELDTCQGGLEGQGYERIIFLTNDIEDGNFVAVDAEIDPGLIYCYRVVPEFAQTTSQGNPFNAVQGLASEEICVRSSGDTPLITHVDVLSTDDNTGAIRVEWLNPDASSVDTTILVGPYRLDLSTSPDLSGSSLIDLTSFSYDIGQFGSIDDTTFTHAGINTMGTGHSYQLSFSSGPTEVGRSLVASSIFAEAISSDESVVLNWDVNVPWNNRVYRIYQPDDLINPIDSTTDQTIRISELENDQEFCFIVEGEGSFNIDGLPDPLINRSNEVCAIPMDDVPPCPPQVEVTSVCDDQSLFDNGQFMNIVRWSFSDPGCIRSEDIESFIIYFSPTDSLGLTVLATVDADQESFNHILDDNISGCYAISAVDQLGNESVLSEELCIDNCPTYELPNTFTPNQDLANDLFIPRLNRFIDRVEFEVYNRWGQKVFETGDPQLNWTGENMSGKELSEGTYFYTCVVYENRVTGVEIGDILRGSIQLIR